MTTVIHMPASIVVVDDHAIVRWALRNLLQLQSGWKVVGEAASGQAGIGLVEELQPDVVVLDLSLPEMNGVAAIRPIREAAGGTRVIVLTMHDSENLIEDAIRAGACGYVLKSDLEQELINGVTALLNGQTYFNSPTACAVYHRLCGEHKLDAGRQVTELLSVRENEILKLLASGCTNKQAAVRLQLSVRTIENHRARIMHKLEVHSYGDLLRLAMGMQLIEPRSPELTAHDAHHDS